jgi:hypothetical protein
MPNPLSLQLEWSGSGLGCPDVGDLYLYVYVTGHTATPSITASVNDQPVTSSQGWYEAFVLDQWPALGDDGDYTVSITVSDGTYTKSTSTTVTYACFT